ncbi:choice-of-anchor Q domain-containing protein [candidate division KSB1 bacterium]
MNWLEGNIDADPNFIGSGEYPFQLSPNSYAVNAGKPDTTGLALPHTDLAGNPRIYNGKIDKIDMGAYEFQGEPDNRPPYILNDTLTVYGVVADPLSYRISVLDMDSDPITFTYSGALPGGLSTHNSGLISGTPSESGLYTLTAIASDGISGLDTVLVNLNIRVGIHLFNVPSYYPTIQTAIDSSANGDTVLVDPGIYYENFNFIGKNITVGSLFLTTGDTTYISQTIIDGNSSGSVVTFESSENSTALLTGFTITNGYATSSGGGIYINGSNPSVSNVTVTGNSASSRGGGIYLSNSNTTLANVAITGNSAISGGGGIYCYNSNPISTNVLISGNSAKNGGGFTLHKSDPSLTNMTISGNTASEQGGGIYINIAKPNLVNSILWNNSPQEIYFNQNYEWNLLTISFSVVQGGEAGIVINERGTINWLEGNLDIDPLFAGAGKHPYELTGNSLAINTGIADTTGLSLPKTDLAGNPRIYNGKIDRIDMGAYEYQNDPGNRPPIIQNDTLNVYGTVSTPLSYSIPVYDMDYDSISFTFTGTLPAGLTAHNSGLISGTPSESGLFSLTATASDGRSGLDTAFVIFKIKEGIHIINVPSFYQTIQTAIDSSADGDTVLVDPGTYIENINFNGKNTVVGSLFLTSGDLGYVSQTIIDGNENGSVVTFNSGEDSSAMLIGFTITNGNASSGGGIHLNNSSPSLSNLKIIGNFARSAGGISIRESNPVLKNITISGNTASHFSGGIVLSNSSPTLTNIAIIENKVNETDYSAGAGIYLSGSSPDIINVTISGNSVSGIGGGIYLESSNPNLVNSIMWDNSPHEIYFRSGFITISYSNVRGGEVGIATNEYKTVNWLKGNLSIDPLFVGEGEHPYQLTAKSHSVNTGTPDITGLGLPAVDLAGYSRIYDGIIDRIDMGAYEYQGDPDNRPPIIQNDTLNVYGTVATPLSYSISVFDADSDSITFSYIGTLPAGLTAHNSGLISGIPSESGLFVLTAIASDGKSDKDTAFVNLNIREGLHLINVPSYYPTIQSAIDSSVDGDTILVGPGTYIENVNFYGKNITVGSLFFTTGDTAYISQTIIDGNEDGSVATFSNGEEPTSLLIGFTITNGDAARGGGIYLYESSPTLTNLKISRNSAINGEGPSEGGGIYLDDSNPTLINVTISGNSATGISGAWGGGIYLSGSNPTLINVKINENSARSAGGGIYCFHSNPTLTNVIISDNTADAGGGIHIHFYSNPIITNTTICGNTATNTYYNAGGGFYSDDSDPKLVNSIVWDNSPQEIIFFPTVYSGSITISYSNIQGGKGGIITNPNTTVNWLEGNIDADPNFIGASVHPLQLSPSSPAINAGNPDTTGLALPRIDLAGNPRILDGIIDMGAYEYQGESENVTYSETLSEDSAEVAVNYTDNTSLSFQFTSGNMTGQTLSVTKLSTIAGRVPVEQLFTNPLMCFDISLSVEDFSADLTFGYTDSLLNATGINEDSLTVCCYDSIDSRGYIWHACPVTIDKDSNTITVSTDHFSLWAVTSKTEDLITYVSENDIPIPLTYKLHQNYPNPFNPYTTIKFHIQKPSLVSLKIYNIMGQLIKTLISGQMPAGSHQVKWNGTNDLGIKVSSGIYIYRLQTDKFVAVKKMVLIK